MPIKKDLIINQKGSKSPIGNLEPESDLSEPQSKRSVKIFDLIISACLAALFFGLPLFFTGLTLQGLAFEKQIYFYFWLFIGLVSWVIKGMLAGEIKIKRTPLDIFLILFWLAYLAATIFSVDRWHSFWGFFGDPSYGFVNLTALIIAYYFIVSNFTDSRFRWILGSLVVSGILVSTWSALIIFGNKILTANLFSFIPLSLLGSIGGLSSFLGLMMPILAVAIFSIGQSQKINKASKLVISIVLLLLIILNITLLSVFYVYTSWPAVLLGLGFFLIYILAQIVRPQRWAWLPFVLFILAFSVFMIGNLKIAPAGLPIEVAPSYELSWQVARESLKDNLFLGSGPATYGYNFSLYRPADFNLNSLYDLRFYQGRGIIFDLLSTVGIIGTAAFTLLIISFLGVAIYLLSKDRGRNKIFSLGFFSAAIVLLAGGLLNRIEGPLILIGALISIVAISLLLKESEEREREIKLSFRASPKFALTLAFLFILISAGVVFSFIFVAKIFITDIKAGFVAKKQNNISSLAQLSQVAILNSKEARYYTGTARQYMVLANNEAAKPENERDINLLRGYLDVMIFTAKQGQFLMPNDVLANEILAQAYETASFYVSDSLGFLRLAEEYYLKAQALEPNNPNFDVKLGLLKTYAAQASKDEGEKKKLIEEAKSFFEKAVNKKNNFGAAYYNLALIEEVLGNVDAAIANMDKAAFLEPSNIAYVFNLGRLYQSRGKANDNETAEKIFKAILGINNKEVNTHFNLALLYEKMQRKDDAIKEYQEVLGLLPEQSAEVKSKIEEMIKKVESGGSNLSENVNTQSTTSTTEVPPETSQ